MDDAAWQRAKDILDDALKLATSERTAFVRQQCPEPGLQAEILDLLGRYDSQFMPSAPAGEKPAGEELPLGEIGRAHV